MSIPRPSAATFGVGSAVCRHLYHCAPTRGSASHGTRHVCMMQLLRAVILAASNLSRRGA
jgi:hypothetical protein